MKTFTLAATAVALFVSVPAASQPPARAVVIPTAGLDLATADGRARLDARIRDAAATACAASPADLHGQVRAGRCRADLIAAARTHGERMVARRGGGALLAARR